jgi:MFS family permease
LIATIIIYAVFTGAAALSETWWHLAIYRFLTALGIGGEWAAGAAIVAETWPEEKRAKAAGILQSAWAVGFFLAATFNLTLKETYGWRGLFLVGVLPAFVALLIRWWVKEPERWTHAHEQKTIPLSAIFEGNLRRGTLVGSALAFVAVFGLWGSTNWAPTLIRELPELKGQDPATLTKYVSYAIMALNAGAIFGYLGFGPLADRFGRRPVFAFMCVGSFVMLPIAFLVPTSYAGVLMLLPILGYLQRISYLPARTLSDQTSRHWRRVLLQRGTHPGLRLAISDRVACYHAGHIRPSRQHSGIDLPGRIGRVNLCTGDQGQTPAGISIFKSASTLPVLDIPAKGLMLSP